MEVAIYIPAS